MKFSVLGKNFIFIASYTKVLRYMFSNSKDTPFMDPVQRDLYEHARNRVTQKKILFIHFIIFVVGSLFFLLMNLVFGFGKETLFFDTRWSFVAIMIWAFALALHFANVWLFHSFMGKEWTDRQMERLINKQKEELALIQRDVDLMYPKEELLKKKQKFIEEKTPNDAPPAIDPPIKQTVTMIAAAGENNALGKDNDLVWHLPDDFKRFKELTTGHYIIMGRKTFESFPKLLPNRKHIVITRNKEYTAEDVQIVSSIEEALEIAKDDPNPFIIGGGEIYSLGLIYADSIELTRVHDDFEADAFFPEINKDTWELVEEKFHDKDDKHKYPFTYLSYKRK